jgi:hypothetical protein
MRDSDFQSISDSQNMGIDSGGYDPTQSSVSDNNVNTNANIAAAIQNQNIGGGDTYDAKQALQTARGITSTNPYGYNNPFQGIADFFGVDVNYNNLMSQGDMNDIANKNYNRYVNPMNDPNRPGFDPNKLASQTQKDLNKGFGSLFGSSLGEQTQLGQIKEQKPDALSGMDTGALNVFSMLGGGLPSLMANLNANPSNFIPEQASQYDPTRDPMSKKYDAETYDKSYIGSALDTMFGEGTTKQTTTIVDDAVNYLKNAGKP